MGTNYPHPKDFTLWRPRTPDEFWNYPGDRELRRAIARLKNEGPPRVSLFEGPFGTGKTSTAYYLGMWASCANRSSIGLPCGNCEACHCVLYGQGSHRCRFFEIDGTRSDIIDEVHRAFGISGEVGLFDAFRSTPNKSSPGVIFVDEAQRITPKCQDGLLKIFERNSGTRFVLATTELDKVDGGILSRAGTAVYRLSPPTEAEAIQHMQRMAREAGGELDPDIAGKIVTKYGCKPRVCLSSLNELFVKSPHIDLSVWNSVYGDDHEEASPVANGQSERW